MNSFESGKIFFQKVIEDSGKNFDDKLIEMSEREKSKELVGKNEWKGIKDDFKKRLSAESTNNDPKFREMPEKMKAEMEEKFREIDDKYTINGVHFLKCQFSEIVKSLINKRRVEYEAFGPYLKDYFDYMFKESVENIEFTKQDEIGLEIMKLFKNELIPEAHVVSLYDEYNLGVTAALPSGMPFDRDYNPNKYEIHFTHNNLADSGQLSDRLPGKKSKGDKKNPPVSLTYIDRGRLNNESEILKNEFRKFVENVLRSKGITKDGEKEGRDQDYTLISESQKVEDAKKLVKVLEEKGLIEGDITSEIGEIWFQNKIEECDDPRYLRIKLRDEEGHWECAALDASGFLDKSNRNITHLVILPKENFEEQQDQVWEILHSIGFEPENYHNIFIDVEDEKVTPESTVETIKSKIMG